MDTNDLLAKSVDTVIRTNLGVKTLERIENRLSKKYHISIAQSVYEFDKLDDVLSEFFGEAANGLKERIYENVRFQSANV